MEASLGEISPSDSDAVRAQQDGHECMRRVYLGQFVVDELARRPETSVRLKNRTLLKAGLIISLGMFCVVRSLDAQQPKSAKPPAAKDSSVRRVQPVGIPGLPAQFLEKLNARGCTIPQFDGDRGNVAGSDPGSVPTPNNVIHGEFARKGQDDWAVLCSNGRSSTIVIFWGKDTACPGSLARLDDAHYSKAGTDKKLRYWRSIRALGENELDDRAGIAGMKPLAHQGIDDRFVGKSSSFFYCNDGKWKIFPAKDSASE